MILIKVPPHLSFSFALKSYSTKLKSLSFTHFSIFPTELQAQTANIRRNTQKKRERKNEQTAVMKCIIIFSLSSMKLFLWPKQKAYEKCCCTQHTHFSLMEKEQRREAASWKTVKRKHNFHFSCVHTIHFHNIMLLLLLLCVYFSWFSVW